MSEKVVLKSSLHCEGFWKAFTDDSYPRALSTRLVYGRRVAALEGLQGTVALLSHFKYISGAIIRHMMH